MAGSRMSREDEFRIRAIDLHENLAISSLAVDFFKIGSMGFGDRQEIMSIPRDDERVERYIELLVAKGGPDGYKQFKDLLREDHDYIIEMLDNVVVTQKEIDPWYWFNGIDERIRLRRITDADASRISRCLGRGWENLMMELGIRKNDIYTEKENCRHIDNSSVVICKLLIRWWHSKYNAATVQALVDKMRELDRDLFVDFDKLKAILEKEEAKLTETT